MPATHRQQLQVLACFFLCVISCYNGSCAFIEGREKEVVLVALCAVSYFIRGTISLHYYCSHNLFSQSSRDLDPAFGCPLHFYLIKFSLKVHVESQICMGLIVGLTGEGDGLMLHKTNWLVLEPTFSHL